MTYEFSCFNNNSATIKDRKNPSTKINYTGLIIPQITTSRHMQRSEYSLKMNIFFYLNAKKDENLSTCFPDLKNLIL